MKPRHISTARLAFALPSTALALLASGSLASAQTVSLNFESETAGSTTVPTGWSYTSIGAGKSYTTTTAGGGSNGAGGNSGLGGVLVSDNGTHGTIIPKTYLVNSGTPAGFDTSKAITGTYDFKQANGSQSYDSSAFLFGDIKSGSLPKTDAGQLLLAYHSNGGYGNSPNRIVNGTETDLAAHQVNHNDDVWYRATFTWTPTAGTKGNFTWSTKLLSTNAAVANMTATGVTLTPAGAYFGFADLYAPSTTFDNISVTGTTFAGAYWDTNGTTAGAGNPATGTWDGTAKWNPSADGTGTNAAWAAGGVAIFSAGNDSIDPYTVTVSGTQDIGGLSFENGTTTITGDALRMVSNSYAFVKPGGTATIASNITDDAGARVFSKTGTGTLILTGDNSGASGSMILADGITEVGALNSILGSGKNLTIDASATLRFGAGVGTGNIQTALNRIVASSTGVIAADNYDATNLDFNTAGLTAARLGAVGSVNYTGTLTPQGTVYRLGGGGGTLTMANTNALTGAGRSLIIQGNVVLAGANDYDSGTTLSSGTLTLGNAGSLGAGGLTITGGTIAANGTVATTNTIAANGDFSIGGTGTLTMGGNMTLNANRIITNNNTTNTTTFGAISGATRTLTFSGNGNTTVSGDITTTTGTLTKNGTGRLTLNGSNNYTGATTINAGGVLRLSGNGTLGTTAGNATIASGAALELNNLNASVGELLNNVAGTGVSSGGAIRNIAGSNTIATLVTITGATRINSDADTLTFDVASGNAIGATNQGLTFGGAGNITVADAIATGSGSVTKDGNGTLTLSGTNTYTGATAVQAGNLVAGSNAPSVAGAGAFGNATSEINLGVAGGSSSAGILISGANTVGRNIRILTNNSTDTGTRALTLGGNTAHSSEFSGNIILGTTNQAGRGVTLTAAASGQVTFSGAIQNPTGMDATTYTVTKSGLGTVVLSNNTNTYTGATLVSAGVLAIGGSGSINTTSSITVDPGGTLRYNSSTALTKAPTLNGTGILPAQRAVLGGTGTVGTAVTLDNLGDTLSPGNSPGLQNYTPAQSWASFSYDWEVNNFTGTTAGTDFDQLGLASTLNLTGGSGSYILNVLGLTAGNVPGLVPNFSEIDRSWTILTSTGITGFNAANWTIDTAGFTDPDTGTWALGQSGNNIVLSYTAIPEPRAALLGGLGLLMLLRRRR